MNALMLTIANSRTAQALSALGRGALERHFCLKPIQPAAMFDLVSDCRKGGPSGTNAGTLFLFSARRDTAAYLGIRPIRASASALNFIPPARDD